MFHRPDLHTLIHQFLYTFELFLQHFRTVKSENSCALLLARNSTANSDLGHCTVEVSRPHTITHTPSTTPPNKLSAHCRDHYSYNTQQTHQTNFHDLHGIWTHDPSNLVTADLNIQQHSHQDLGHTILIQKEATKSHPINLELTAIQSHSTWVQDDWTMCKSYALVTLLLTHKKIYNVHHFLHE
jgi:hypothetical protein